MDQHANLARTLESAIEAWARQFSKEAVAELKDESSAGEARRAHLVRRLMLEIRPALDQPR